MKMDEITLNQKVVYKGQVGTVTKITRSRVFVHIEDTLPEIVNARSLRAYVETETATVDDDDLTLEYVPHAIRAELLDLANEPAPEPVRNWNWVDTTAVCVATAAIAFMAAMPYWI